MMVKIGNVWDRTVDVLNGRTAMIGTIALAGLVVPEVARDAYVAAATPGTGAFALIGSILGIAAFAAMLWAQLAICAIATDPGTTRAQAAGRGVRRLGPAIGITLLLGLAALVATLPAGLALAGSGFDFAAAARGDPNASSTLSSGTALFVTIYVLVLGVVAIWLLARLALLNPVILNEARGIGAIRRSVQLTRGLTWRILGVVILFGITLLVAAGAAQAVVGVVFRLALGGDGATLAAFLAGIAGTLVAAAFTAIASVFVTQLYVAVTAAAAAPGVGMNVREDGTSTPA